MNMLRRVAVFEYRRNVFKKSFILMVLSVPLMITLSLCFGFTVESLRVDPLPAGYIDEAGTLITTQLPAEMARQKQFIDWIAFQSVEEAQAALKAGQIQAYFRIPAGFQYTRQVEVGYLDPPGENAWQQFYDLLRYNLLSDESPATAFRLTAGSEIIIRSVDGIRQTSPEAPTFGLMMPLFITLAFLIMMLTSSGYMMSALIEEKENRTLEVLIASISPAQLMAGKIIGVVAISLTLLLAWAIVITSGVWIAAQAGMDWFSDLTMDWRGVLETFAIGIPAYVLAAALMISIGALAGSNQESQSVSTIIFILHALPLYVSATFINSPHGPLQTALSLLPFSALMTIGMRNVFTIVPLWQVLASFAMQCLCAVGAIWLAGRALRYGMQHYGQRFNWRALAGLITKELA